MGATTLRIMTLSIDIQNNYTQQSNKQNATPNITTHSIMGVLVCWVSFMPSVMYAECHYSYPSLDNMHDRHTVVRIRVEQAKQFVNQIKILKLDNKNKLML
jgi:hypothetical protein